MFYYYLNNITRPTTLVRYSRTPLFVFRKPVQETEDEEDEEDEEEMEETDEDTILGSLFRSIGMTN